MSDTSANEPRLIKKYPNRRLYDTVKSTYITLEELADLVRTGEQVEVVGAKSGEDLTRQVLTQVILEEKGRLELIPVEMLHYVIQVQGTNMAGPFDGFLNQIFSQFRDLNGTGVGPGTGMEAAAVGMQVASKVATQWADTWMSTMNGGSGNTERAAAQETPVTKAAATAAAPVTAESATAAARDELSNLRDRMESLLDRLQQDE